MLAVEIPFMGFDATVRNRINKTDQKKKLFHDQHFLAKHKSPDCCFSTVNHKFYVTEMDCWNPAFDVTPAELITGGVVTEFGVFKPNELKHELTQCLNRKASLD